MSALLSIALRGILLAWNDRPRRKRPVRPNRADEHGRRNAFLKIRIGPGHGSVVKSKQSAIAGEERSAGSARAGWTAILKLVRANRHHSASADPQWLSFIVVKECCNVSDDGEPTPIADGSKC